MEPASGQIIFNADGLRGSDDPWRDNRLTGVKDRAHADYQPIGIRLAGQKFYPEFMLAAAYDSNLLALDKPAPEDVVFSLQPKFTFASHHRANDLKLTGQWRINRHVRRKLEDSDEYAIAMKSSLAIARGYSLDFVAGFGRYIEPRGDSLTSAQTVRPTVYHHFFARGSFQKTAGRVLIRSGIDVTNFSFEDGVLRAEPSIIVRESRRSRSEFRPFVDAEYSLTPDAAVFIGFRSNAKRHDKQVTPLINRDSRGFGVSAGFRFKPSPLVQISAAAGYLEQYHKRPLSDVKGLSAELKLKWLPTQLTTVTVSFLRQGKEGGAISPGSGFVNQAAIGVDHELRRNLIIDLRAGYEGRNFPGISRRDRP